MAKVGPPQHLESCNNPLIRISQVKKAFHDRQILDGIDLDIPKGQLTVIIGRSGCGKSTLLRCMNGLETFDAGTITIGDDELLPNVPIHLRGRVGMVFQSFNLFPHLTALENLLLAPKVVKDEDLEETRARAMGLLDKVGLKSHAHHYPLQMSGGQQQRAAIARALTMQPEVLLYDEPTSALDPWLVDEVLSVMRSLNREGLTQVVVTHEMSFAKELADEIVYLSEGKVLEIGPPSKIFKNPAQAETRQFLQKFL